MYGRRGPVKLESTLEYSIVLFVTPRNYCWLQQPTVPLRNKEEERNILVACRTDLGGPRVLSTEYKRDPLVA